MKVNYHAKCERPHSLSETGLKIFLLQMAQPNMHSFPHININQWRNNQFPLKSNNTKSSLPWQPPPFFQTTVLTPPSLLYPFDHLQYFTQPFWPPLSFIPLYFDHPQSCLVCFDYPRSFLLLCFDHLQSFLLMLSTAVFYFHKYTHLTKGPRKKQFSN